MSEGMSTLQPLGFVTLDAGNRWTVHPPGIALEPLFFHLGMAPFGVGLPASRSLASPHPLGLLATQHPDG